MEIKSENTLYIVVSLHDIVKVDGNGNDYYETEQAVNSVANEHELLDVVCNLKSDKNCQMFEVFKGVSIYTHPKHNSIRYRTA